MLIVKISEYCSCNSSRLKPSERHGFDEMRFEIDTTSHEIEGLDFLFDSAVSHFLNI